MAALTSPFLERPASEHVASNALAFAIADRFPVSPGHTLVVPRRLVATWFDATPDEQRAIFALVDEVKALLDARAPRPDGYNVGFNAGAAAGQTVMHLHVHVIPRYAGDVDDPRGGVRHVIPGKGNYLAAPRAEADPAFVERLLALLDGSHFTATYKYAVLLGLVDLCLEHADEHGAAPTSVTTRQLAEKVLALYWPQTAPFQGCALRQNRGGQGEVLTAIAAFRERHAADPSAPLSRARAAAPVAFAALVTRVEATLVEMPLPRVQRLASGEERRFLYDIAWDERSFPTRGRVARGDFDNVIRFVGGASEQLVALASVVRPVVQRHWAAMVARLNTPVVQDALLEEFLFGAARVSLAPVTRPLVELHGGACFYCQGPLSRGEVAVDHFIAWSRHPDDAIENLVPAHAGCNGSKSDHLASAEHLARWVARMRDHAAHLDAIARRAAWERDAPRALAVARGIYLRLRRDARLWQRERRFEAPDRDALRLALAG